MFFGEYEHNIDDKGRLTIPSKFRESLGTEFVVTKGLDQCLFVFTNEEWTAFQSKLGTLPLSDKDARMFMRFFVASALECSLDKQGRIGLTPSLRKYAKLDKESTIIGVSSRLEIWNRSLWEEYTDLDAEEIADRMAELGI